MFGLYSQLILVSHFSSPLPYLAPHTVEPTLAPLLGTLLRTMMYGFLGGVTRSTNLVFEADEAMTEYDGRWIRRYLRGRIGMLLRSSDL